MKVGNEFYCEKAWIVVTFYFSVKQKNSCIHLPPAGDTSKWSFAFELNHFMLFQQETVRNKFNNVVLFQQKQNL